MFRKGNGDRNDNGIQDVTISKGLQPHWRERIKEVTTSPDGTTEKLTTNDKTLEAYEKVNERLEQASVLPPTMSEAVCKVLTVFIGSRLLLTVGATLWFIPLLQPLAIFLLLVWFISIGLVVARCIEKPSFLSVCWWIWLVLLGSVVL